MQSSKSSPPTNQHLVFYRPDALPVAQPTVSEHWRDKTTIADHYKYDMMINVAYFGRWYLFKTGVFTVGIWHRSKHEVNIQYSSNTYCNCYQWWTQKCQNEPLRSNNVIINNGARWVYILLPMSGLCNSWDRRYVTRYEAAKNSNSCIDPSHHIYLFQ